MPENRPLIGRPEVLGPLRRAFWVGLLSLLGVAGALAALAAMEERSTDRVLHEAEVARVAREALGLALDRQAAVGDFRLSGDARSLASEVATRAALPRKLDTLLALTRDNPRQQARGRVIVAAVARWSRDVADPALRLATPSAADRLAGKLRFDEVRAAYAAFLSAEDPLYLERVQREHDARRALIVVGAIAIALLLGVFFWFRARVMTQAKGLVEQQELLEGQAMELELQTEALEAQTADLAEKTRAAELAASETVEQRQFLREVIDTIPAFVFAKDGDGRFTLANRSVAQAYGTTPAAIVGRTDADFNKNAEEVAAFRRDELEVMESGRDLLIPEEVVTDSTGAMRWLETVKRPLAFVGPDGARALHVLGVATDITARKRAEAALRASEDRLRQGQKMEAVGRLAGGIAHDFNNVLTAIRSYSDFLLEDLDASDAHRGDVEEIGKAANRAAALVRQLLAFSRQQVLRPRALDLNATVGDLAPMLGRLLGDDVRLEVRLESPLGVICADPGQLEQVLVNLAMNARDAMLNGGALTVETSNVQLDEGHTSNGVTLAPGSYILLAVSDTGVGMDRETQAQVFDPFFTTKEVGQGTGLGLATVYGIVKQSGGYVWVYSELGQGTTFKIYLPRVDEAQDDDLPEREIAWSSDDEPSMATVLLVEDDSAVRAAARRTLLRAGYLLLEASHGAEALALCTAPGAPTIDLVVTDLVMPEMGGLELGAELRARLPGTRILYMSGYTRDAIRRQSSLEPGTSFLEKPFTPQAFVRSVRAALGGDSSVGDVSPARHASVKLP
jgi:PAS domain S-box-containing protein